MKANDCMRDSTLHCLQATQVNKAYANQHLLVIDRKKYCGIIAIVSDLSKPPLSKATFTASGGYLMYFNILLFNFEWSDLGCHDHGLIIKVSSKKTLFVLLVGVYHGS